MPRYGLSQTDRAIESWFNERRFQPNRTQSVSYYLWFQHSVSGHAALIIDSANLDYQGGANYVSWWGTAGKGNFLTGMLNTQSTVLNDILGQCYDGGMKSVMLTELDRDAMRAKWEEIRNKEGANWKLFDKNCSTVVARVLKAGGGNTFCTNKAKSHPLIWTPANCYQYAKSIAKHGGRALDRRTQQ